MAHNGQVIWAKRDGSSTVRADNLYHIGFANAFRLQGHAYPGPMAYAARGLWGHGCCLAVRGASRSLRPQVLPYGRAVLVA